jgi:hypothetical protein
MRGDRPYPRSRRPYHFVNLVVDTKLKEELRRVAFREHETQSVVVRRLLRFALDAEARQRRTLAVADRQERAAS